MFRPDAMDIKIYLFLTLFSPSVAADIQCMECVDQPNPFDCRTVTTCSSHEKCVVEQVVTSGGLILYNQGCRSMERCANGKRNLVSRQNPVSTTDIITCEECCDGDYCNLQGCGQTMKLQPDRGPICYNCDAQAAPDTCRDVLLCDLGQVCTLIRTALYSTTFTSMCARKMQCDHISKRELVNSCPVCCEYDFCNKNCTHNATLITTTTTTASSSLPTTPLITSSPTTIFVPTHPISAVQSTVSSTIASSTHIPTSPSTSLVTTPVVSPVTSSIVSSTPVPSNTTSSTTDSSSVTLSTVSSTPVPSNTTSTTDSSSVTSSMVSTTPVPSNTTSSTSYTVSSSVTSRTISTSHVPSSTTSSPPATMSPIISTTPMSDCSQAIDICFVLDTSGSVGPAHFHEQLMFVNSIVNQMAWKGHNIVRACVVTFSTISQMDIALRTYHHSVDFMDGVLNISYRDGETRTDLGINKATVELTHLHHGRHTSTKVMVVVTDGHSTEPTYTLHSSQRAHSAGIHTIAVGVGSHINMPELQGIASDHQSTYTVGNFDDLNSVNQPIVNQLAMLCHGN